MISREKLSKKIGWKTRDFLDKNLTFRIVCEEDNNKKCSRGTWVQTFDFLVTPLVFRTSLKIFASLVNLFPDAKFVSVLLYSFTSRVNTRILLSGPSYSNISEILKFFQFVHFFKNLLFRTRGNSWNSVLVETCWLLSEGSKSKTSSDSTFILIFEIVIFRDFWF